MNEYSVLIPLGHMEPPAHVRQCLQSIVGQTAPPREIVFVCDHVTPTPLLDVIRECLAGKEIKYFSVDCTDLHREGKQLGAILARGVEKCSYELIARMDADDIAPRDRCALQLAEFRKNPSLALVGGVAAEFTDSSDRVVSYRRLPEDSIAIARFAKYRNPFNHSSVMFRRSVVLNVGNYSPTLKGCEDYDLWYRIIAAGEKVINLPQILLYSRVGIDLTRRRRNPQNTVSAFEVKRRMLQDGFITRAQYIISGAAILFLRYAPETVVKHFYAWVLRTQDYSTTNIL